MEGFLLDAASITSLSWTHRQPRNVASFIFALWALLILELLLFHFSHVLICVVMRNNCRVLVLSRFQK